MTVNPVIAKGFWKFNGTTYAVMTDGLEERYVLAIMTPLEFISDGYTLTLTTEEWQSFELFNILGVY